MTALYPLSEPFVQHSVEVGDGHTLHVQEHGRVDGVPAVFLHGGPGAASAAWHTRFFDPDLYRVVLFDQRGCGRSTPHASLEANTTWHLVEDLERLRTHLGIERWLVFGGSWGSTLALAYAETHPERVSALVLRGIALCRPRDIAWFFQCGAHRLMPEYWREFVAPIPPEERGDLLTAYHRRLFGNDDIARMSAAKAWALWEGRATTLLPAPDVVTHFSNPSVALSLARIECDYFVHDCYLQPDQLVRDVRRLAGIPAVIVHGRYDLVCPVDQADELARAWPEAEYRIVPDAGHAALEPGTARALVEATDRLGSRLGSA